jgi:hypothetical protein
VRKGSGFKCVDVGSEKRKEAEQSDMRSNESLVEIVQSSYIGLRRCSGIAGARGAEGWEGVLMKWADEREKEGMKKWERLESYRLLPSFHVLKSLRCNRKAILVKITAVVGL